MLNKALDRLFKQIFRQQLEVKGGASALARILTSQHTRDVRFIGLIAGLLSASILVLILASLLPGIGPAVKFLTQGLYSENDVLKLAGVGALGGVISWAYQTGSQRLGTVDLFASEISAICRVSLVIDFARKCVAQVELRERPDEHWLERDVEDELASSRGRRFTSEEKYTPVYDTNLKGLESLDAAVVSRVTEFYTYRKTMMDYLRRAYALPPDRPEWFETMREMIYMQYLMYESGRQSIEELIEFDPDREESIINILCSEFSLYCFLLDHYRPKNNIPDYRHERLQLRASEYKDDYHALMEKVRSEENPAWDRARTTAKELRRRYEDAFSRKIGVEDHRRAA